MEAVLVQNRGKLKLSTIISHELIINGEKTTTR